MRSNSLKLGLLGASGIAAAWLAAMPTANGALLDGMIWRAELFHKTTVQDPPADVASPLFVIGPGVELTGFGPQSLPPLVDIDLSDRNILITAVADQPLAFQELLTFRNVRDDLQFSVNPATNWAGFTPDRLVRADMVMGVDLAELSGLAGQQILLDVVPEPSSAGLLMAGAATLGAVARRRVWRRGRHINARLNHG
jgi:hypothetical protein